MKLILDWSWVVALESRVSSILQWLMLRIKETTSAFEYTEDGALVMNLKKRGKE